MIEINAWKNKVNEPNTLIYGILPEIDITLNFLSGI